MKQKTKESAISWNAIEMFDRSQFNITYRKERFRMVLWRANCDKLDRSSWPFCPCSNCVCELALASRLLSMLIEPARELVFSIAAISSKQLKNDCFCWTHKCHSVRFYVRVLVCRILLCFFFFENSISVLESLISPKCAFFIWNDFPSKFRIGWWHWWLLDLCVTNSIFVWNCFCLFGFYIFSVSGAVMCICKLIVISKRNVMEQI